MENSRDNHENRHRSRQAQMWTDEEVDVLRRTMEGDEDFSHYQHRRTSNGKKPSPLPQHQPTPLQQESSSASQQSISVEKEIDTIKESLFILRLRELFAAFIGMTLAFTVINFVFVNITGGCLVLFGLLSAIWCFLDRHHATYLLNAILQFLLSITIAIAVSVYFPGFEVYSTDSVLRSISIAHVPFAFVFFVLSLYLASVDVAHHREPQRGGASLAQQ